MDSNLLVSASSSGKKDGEEALASTAEFPQKSPADQA